MLTIGATPRFRSCDGIPRRDFIRLGALSLGGISLAHLLQARTEGATAFVHDRSVVLLYLSGGASQIETFDPKMTAPDGVRSVTGEVATSLAGVTFGGTFGRLAKHADQLAVVRSFGHKVGSHVEAHVHMLSGGTDPRGRQEQGFSIGSCCTRLRGPTHHQTGLPTYALLTEEEIDRQYRKEHSRVVKGSWPGPLGAVYGPLEYRVGWQEEKHPSAGSFATSSNPLVANMQPRLSLRQLEDRLALLQGIDRLRQHYESDTAMDALDKYSQQAVDLVFGGAASAFDFSREDPRTIERYNTSQIQIGHHAFRPSTLGKQMLVARRLCESGCGFVTVHSAGWDMHADGNNPGMRRGMEMLGTSLDIAVSAFIDDVAARGLSDKILLVIAGDFGRTPKLNSRGGRDHWAKLCPLAFVGGGLNMGQVIGQSTANAAEPASDPYTTKDLMTTVLHTLFDFGQLRLQSGIPRALTQVFESGRRIQDLF